MRVKHLVLAVTILALSSLSVTACKKKVITIEDLASPSDAIVETERTDETEVESKNNLPVETTDEVNDFSTKFDKRTVTSDKVEVTSVTDPARIAELSGFMKASLNKTYTSIEYCSVLILLLSIRTEQFMT